MRPWRYPPSFDLQYGEWLGKRFERGDSSPLQAAVNADLTTLLTIVLLGDQPLFGPPPRALLDPLLMEDCVTAMVSDIDGFMDEVEEDTRKLLLTLARSWQMVVTGLIERKDRAAAWAQERLPSEYRQLMERARAMDLGWQPDAWADLASDPCRCGLHGLANSPGGGTSATGPGATAGKPVGVEHPNYARCPAHSRSSRQYSTFPRPGRRRWRAARPGQRC